ncbi:MAG TPA: endolytic transglycosylase MltG [Candidatus Acidoferrales bacterium]|nr:endolytic transglycosylase MltG [Candidatus Acidoferrales bacterium]
MRRLVFVIVILIAAVAGAAAWVRSELKRPYRGYSQAQIFVEIPRGTPRWTIAEMLQKSGVIDSRVAFVLLSKWHHHGVLQAGEYMFSRPMTPREVYAQIAGGHIYMHTVIVPEGWTMFDIANELAKQGLSSKEDFLRAAQDTSLVRDIAPQAPSLEGFLFPSTYQFSRNTTPQEIVATMVKEFRGEWGKLQNEAAEDPNPDSPELRNASAKHKIDDLVSPVTKLSTSQIVTLASLVERETPQPAERPIVASVFYNRLRLRLRLQCDPTVQYALDLEGKPTPKLTPGDLLVSSDYNTYRHRGLPPGPIANPGDASLRAALDPAQTKYLYFVANGSGGHFFARTLAEHNRNVQKYRRILEGLPPEAPPPVHRRTKPARKRPSMKHRKSTKKAQSRS